MIEAIMHGVEMIGAEMMQSPFISGVCLTMSLILSCKISRLESRSRVIEMTDEDREKIADIVIMKLCEIENPIKKEVHHA